MLLLVGLLSLYLVLLCSTTVSSLSTQPSRLSRIGTIDNVIIKSSYSHLHKRGGENKDTNTSSKQVTLQEEKGVKLEFTAFDKRILLNLDRNGELFHPNASVTIFNKHATIESIELLEPSDYSIYKGHTNNNRDEWARITLRQDLEHLYPFPVFEGAFTLNSEIYHVKTRRNFKLSKRNDDPEPSDLSPMVIYKDSDQYHPTMEKRDHNNHSVIMCAMEELAYNRRMTGYHTTNQSAFASLWERRDSLTPVSPTALQGCPTSRKIIRAGLSFKTQEITHVESGLLNALYDQRSTE
ncbi:hypothetical protein K501DRAFT_270575 [Backusella circina FSU 941]|nr:hypothetical protein K501DRAFT_270575 [Backusella circina FSU 941]